MSPHRENARKVIAPVVHMMRGAKRKDIRRVLRAAWHDERSGAAYKAWCSEVAIALRERSRRPKSHSKPRSSADVMPSMRDWAMDQGILDVQAVFDVDGDTDENAWPIQDTLL